MLSCEAKLTSDVPPKNQSGGVCCIESFLMEQKGMLCAAAQGVYIFAADCVVMPIHDHLHWSLALLCLLGDDGWAKSIVGS